MEPIREATTVMGGLIFDVGTTGPGALVPMSEGRASIQLWNQGQAREVDRANPQEPGFDMALRIREDGTSLALLTALGLGPAVEMVSLAAGTSSRLIRLNTPPGAVAMNLGVAGDGSVVAALTSQDLVILRAGEGEGGVDQRLVPLQGIATDVSVTDCGSTVAVAMKGRIFLVDSTSGTSRPVELKPGQTVSNSVFSDNGRLLLAPTGEDVALIQVPEGRVSGSLVSATGGRIVAAALSPGGGLAASVSREGRLSLWDVTTRDELASINLESGALMQVRFMPGGKRVRWWGEKQSGIFDLEQGFGRLAKNLPDRLPVVLPSIVGQAGALSTLELVRALRPYGGQSAVDAEQTLTNLVRGRKAAGGQ
jgi:WD40 repeat protein